MEVLVHVLGTVVAPDGSILGTISSVRPMELSHLPPGFRFQPVRPTPGAPARARPLPSLGEVLERPRDPPLDARQSVGRVLQAPRDPPLESRQSVRPLPGGAHEARPLPVQEEPAVYHLLRPRSSARASSGAEGGSRTRNPLRELGPEPSSVSGGWRAVARRLDLHDSLPDDVVRVFSALGFADGSGLIVRYGLYRCIRVLRSAAAKGAALRLPSSWVLAALKNRWDVDESWV